jgi:hypothetical protein
MEDKAVPKRAAFLSKAVLAPLVSILPDNSSLY